MGSPPHAHRLPHLLPLKKRTKFGGEPDCSQGQMSGGPALSGSASAAGSASAVTGNTMRSGQPDHLPLCPGDTLAGRQQQQQQPQDQQHGPAGRAVAAGAAAGPSAFKPVVPHKARSKRGSNRVTINTHTSGATGDTSGSWGSGDSASSQGGSGGKAGAVAAAPANAAGTSGRRQPSRRPPSLDGVSAQVSGIAGTAVGPPAVQSAGGNTRQRDASAARLQLPGESEC